MVEMELSCHIQLSYAICVAVEITRLDVVRMNTEYLIEETLSEKEHQP